MTDDWVLEDHWITVDKAPARVGVSKQTVYSWIRKGKIRTLRPSRKLWVNVEDLLRAEKVSRLGRFGLDNLG